MVVCETADLALMTTLTLCVGDRSQIVIDAVMFAVAGRAGDFGMILNRRIENSKICVSLCSLACRDVIEQSRLNIVRSQRQIRIKRFVVAIQTLFRLRSRQMIATTKRIDNPGKGAAVTGLVAGNAAVLIAILPGQQLRMRHGERSGSEKIGTPRLPDSHQHDPHNEKTNSDREGTTVSPQVPARLAFLSVYARTITSAIGSKHTLAIVVRAAAYPSLVGPHVR